MDIVKTYPINETFKDIVKDIAIPTFVIKVNNNSIFESHGSFVPLRKNLLLEGFDLSKEDTKIDFSISSTDVAEIDIVEERKNEFVPKFQEVTGEKRQFFKKYISRLAPESQIRQLATKLARQSIQIDEIAEPHIINYIKSALENLSSDKISEIAEHNVYYSNVIKKRFLRL